jgi:glycosyltransferase involved in cell wall biosynthesis
MKIAFVVPRIMHYRISFFEKLSVLYGDNFKVFASVSQSESSRPHFKGVMNFQNVIVSEGKFDIGPKELIKIQGLVQSVKSFNPDVLIIINHIRSPDYIRTVFWAKKNNKKVIMWTCFWDPGVHGFIKSKIRSFLQKWYFNKADFHIAYSTNCSRKLIEIGFPENCIHIGFNGIELSDFSNIASTELKTQDLKYYSEKFVTKEIRFLYIGGLGIDKKVDLLLQAWSIFIKSPNVKNVRLFIVGSGPEEDKLKKLSNGIGIESSVDFLGRIEKDKQFLFEAIHVLVLPGTGGLALNEAVLFKKPIIVSEADGTEHDLVLNGFNGLFFEKDSINSLKNKMLNIYTNYHSFKSNSDTMSNLVLNRSNVDQMVKTFKNTIDKCL